MKSEKVIFKDREHEEFYLKYLEKCRYQDVNHRALIYCLGISGDARRNISSVYDFKSGLVKTECLRQGWITSGSGRVIRMAFNLYCNGAPSVYDQEGHEEQLREYSCYTVEDLFCGSDARYFWEAVKIRYPEYCYERG